VNVANDPFMTRGESYSHQAPGRRMVNVHNDPWMTRDEGGPRRGHRWEDQKATDVHRTLQVTVGYVTNLKHEGWGCGRQTKPHVLCDLLASDGGRRGIQNFRANPRFDRTVPADVLQKARHSMPTNFDQAGVFRNVSRDMKLRFRVVEEGMFGKKDLCHPFEFALREVFDTNAGWDRAVEEYMNQGDIGMKIQILQVKDPARNKFRALLEDRGIPQDLMAIAVLQAPAEEGQNELEAEISFEQQKKLKLVAGENLFIAPEVSGKREMVRLLKFVRKGNRCFIGLDTRLRLPHGIGTTVAIRSTDGIFRKGKGMCGSCFEHCKICIHECRHGTAYCCLVDFWLCCICCLEMRKVCAMCCNWCLGKYSLRDLRRQCAQRCNLPYDPAISDDDGKDTACCCIPLRTAVFLLSLVSFAIAAVDFIFPSMVEGISLRSHVVAGVISLTGLIFGPIGAMGALQLQVNLLMMYNYFQIARLFSKLYCLYTDAPLIFDCDIWRNDIVAATKKYGWNPYMYNLAMDNSCYLHQASFVIGNVVCFWLFIYLISLTRKLIWECESTPNYLLSMPQQTPSGAFMTYSRTQGRHRPPYGAIDGSDYYAQGEKQQHEVVGAPIGVYKPLHFNRNLTRGPLHFTY